MKLSAVIFSLFLAITAQAATETNQVATSGLMFVSSVTKLATEGNAEATVTAMHEENVNGDIEVVEIPLSKDDVVTVYFEGQGYPVTPSQPARVPYVFGGTYKVELKRFNGEVYSSEAVMSEQIFFSGLNDGDIVSKLMDVTLTWNEMPTDNYGWMTMIFCDGALNGDVMDNGRSLTFPAGLTSQCTGDSAAAAMVYYSEMGTDAGVELYFDAGTSDMRSFTFGGVFSLLDVKKQMFEKMKAQKIAKIRQLRSR